MLRLSSLLYFVDMPRQSGMSDEDDNHMSQGSEDIPMDDINEDSPNVDGPTSSNHSIHITVDGSFLLFV